MSDGHPNEMIFESAFVPTFGSSIKVIVAIDPINYTVMDILHTDRSSTPFAEAYSHGYDTVYRKGKQIERRPHAKTK